MTLAQNKNSMISSAEVISLRGRVARRLAELQIRVETPIETDVYRVAGIAAMRFRPPQGSGQKVGVILAAEADIGLAAGIMPRMYLDEASGAVVAEFLMAKPDTLYMSDLLDAPVPYGMAIGRDVQGNPLYVNLDDDTTAHALVVGTTGAGKSALTHTMCGTVARATPRLKLITYDPAHPGFAWLMPHIKANLIEEVTTPARLFIRLTQLVDVISSSSNVPGRCLVYIDELRDLIQAEPRIVEPLTRIAQRGRAAGIHLLCATQTPSRKSLPPDLLRNIGARVVLAVADRTESQMASGDLKIDAHKLPRPGHGVLVSGGQAVRFIAATPDNYQTAQGRGFVEVQATSVEGARAQEPLPIKLHKPAPHRLETIARRDFALPAPPANVSPVGEALVANALQTLEAVPVGVPVAVATATLKRPADSYSLEELVELLIARNPAISIRTLVKALKPGGAQGGFYAIREVVGKLNVEVSEE